MMMEDTVTGAGATQTYGARIVITDVSTSPQTLALSPHPLH